MKIIINFINSDHNPTIDHFIRTLVSKTFKSRSDLTSIIVNMKVQYDIQEHWVCNILLNDNSDKVLQAESIAINYLTAFSQTLFRISRQLERNHQTAIGVNQTKTSDLFPL